MPEISKMLRARRYIKAHPCVLCHIGAHPVGDSGGSERLREARDLARALWSLGQVQPVPQAVFPASSSSHYCHCLLEASVS